MKLMFVNFILCFVSQFENKCLCPLSEWELKRWMVASGSPERFVPLTMSDIWAT